MYSIISDWLESPASMGVIWKEKEAAAMGDNITKAAVKGSNDTEQDFTVDMFAIIIFWEIFIPHQTGCFSFWSKLKEIIRGQVKQHPQDHATATLT